MIGINNEVWEGLFCVGLYFVTTMCIIKSFTNSSYMLEGYYRRNWFKFGYGLITFILGAAGTVLIEKHSSVNEYILVSNTEVLFVFISLTELLSLLIRTTLNFQSDKVFLIGPYFGIKYLVFYLMTILFEGVFNCINDMHLCWYFIVSEIIFKFFDYLRGNVIYGKDVSYCRKVFSGM